MECKKDKECISSLVNVVDKKGDKDPNLISFDSVCEKSTCLCVTGENGAEKTTFVKELRPTKWINRRKGI